MSSLADEPVIWFSVCCPTCRSRTVGRIRTGRGRHPGRHEASAAQDGVRRLRALSWTLTDFRSLLGHRGRRSAMCGRTPSMRPPQRLLSKAVSAHTACSTCAITSGSGARPRPSRVCTNSRAAPGPNRSTEPRGRRDTNGSSCPCQRRSNPRELKIINPSMFLHEGSRAMACGRSPSTLQMPPPALNESPVNICPNCGTSTPGL